MKLFAHRVSSRSGSRPRSKTKRIGLFALLAILLCGLVFGLVSFYGIWAQTLDLKQVGQMPERNTVFDVDGKMYSRLAGANRIVVPLKEVSPLFIDALLAREDSRFYGHGGVDPRGV
ncbi:MAG: transglycosylase domain-containing protein, partial [Chthoniobacterales bacterium]|nr:transglycosylase domain-containing protein [Chthoniobacterales bacterium]